MDFVWIYLFIHTHTHTRVVAIRASPTSFAIPSYFTIPKSYFINYIIPFYNTPNIPKLYYFTILLKYYFLIFLYYFFPTVIFFSIQLFQGSIFNNLLVFFFFFFGTKNLPKINVLKFANFKNPHAYIFHQTCQISK